MDSEGCGMQRWKLTRKWPVALGALVVAVAAAGCIPPPAPPAASAPSASPTAVTPGSRDVTQWPFASDSPWNMPLGSGATFDPRPVVTLQNSTPWLNSQEYSIPVVYASASDPLVTVTATGGSFPGPVTLRIPPGARAAAGSDGHLVVISPDRLHANEFWTLDLVSRTAGVNLPVDLRGSGVGIGWVRATGVSALGGLIRSQETGTIRHALAIALPWSVLGSGHVWPAISDDDGGAPGFTPEGSLLAIPAGTPRPPGLSPLGNAIFDAFSRYGAYVVDTTGGSGAAAVVAEPSTPASATGPAASDMRAVMPLLRRVTNNSPSTVGGPGGRLAPLAPALP